MYTVESRLAGLGYINRGQQSFSGCHDTGFYHDVKISSDVIQIVITLTKLEKDIGLRELEFYIGRDDPSFLSSSNLKQDASRTWLVVNDPMTSYFEIDTCLSKSDWVENWF